MIKARHSLPRVDTPVGEKGTSYIRRIKKIALSTMMVLNMGQGAAQTIGNPQLELLLNNNTNQLAVMMIEDISYPINFTSSGNVTSFSIYNGVAGGTLVAQAIGSSITANGSNPSVIASIVTDDNNINRESRGNILNLSFLPLGEYYMIMSGQISLGNRTLEVGITKTSSQININYIADSGGSQEPSLFLNRLLVSNPTLNANNTGLDVPVSINPIESVNSANAIPLAGFGSLAAEQFTTLILMDGPTVINTVSVQPVLGPGGASAIATVNITCGSSVNAIRTSDGYNTNGTPNNPNVAWAGITGTGIGTTTVTPIGLTLPNPGSPAVVGSTVTYTVSNIPAGFTPVGDLGGVVGTWNSSTNQMLFPNVPVGNNTGSIVLGNCSASISANVTTVNNNPVANDDAYTLDEDGSVLLDLLLNDTDVDGNTLSISNINGVGVTGGAQNISVSNGTVDISGAGVMNFVPDANYNGSVAFSYNIIDGNGGNATANSTITVTPLNDLPVANNDVYTVAEDGSVVLNLVGNDTDVDGDILSVSNINGVSLTGGLQNISVSNNTVNISAGGVITFIPSLNYNGSQTFPYTINDGNGGTSTATITITVSAVNDNPVANSDSYNTTEDNNVVVNPLTNDIDIDVADVLSISDINGTTLIGGAQNVSVLNGNVSISAGGIMTFIPNLDYNGPVTFPYTINDGNGGTSTATITITVSAINDAPTGTDAEYTLFKNTNQNFDVSTHTADIDGPNATYVSSTQPLHGTIVDNGAGQYTYTPDFNYFGEDSLYVTRSDGGIQNESVTVKVKLKIEDDAGIDDIGQSFPLTLYPNPTTSTISLQLPEHIDHVAYKIYDMNSRLVDMDDYEAIEGNYIDVASLQDGMYIIQCTADSKTTIQRFIKQ